jgi:hypothetical protein
LTQRKRRLINRIDKNDRLPATPVIDIPALELQLADRTQAIASGGLCPIMLMIKTPDRLTSAFWSDIWSKND